MKTDICLSYSKKNGLCVERVLFIEEENQKEELNTEDKK